MQEVAFVAVFLGLGKGLGGLRRAAIGKRRGPAVRYLLKSTKQAEGRVSCGENRDGQGAQR